MGERAGGADAFARKRANDYHNNANLVLTASREGRPKTKEPTGEPETLAGRKLPKMGDRAARTQATELEELKKRKSQHRQNEAGGESKRSRVATVLDAEIYGSYRPASRETREAHRSLLNMVQRQLGHHPQDILYNATEDVLTVLKDDSMQMLEKEKQVRQMLDADETVLKDCFHEFVALSNRITDWNPDAAAGGTGGLGGGLDDSGVAVDLDDADEEDAQQGLAPEVVPSDDEGADDDVAAGGNLHTDMDLGQDDAEVNTVNVNDIDAYWLQRAIAEAYKESGEPLDAAAAQQKDRDVLRLLGNQKETAELETDLVFQLDFKRFDLIKLLIANREKIVWCTRLMRAKSDAEKESIEAEMDGEPALMEILAQLKATRASARDRKHAMIQEVGKEARRLRDMDSKTGGVPEVVDHDVAVRKVLDLEALQFEGGAHYLANKKVQLPQETFRRLEKGYEEVCIPAPKKRGAKDGALVPISSLPEWAQPAFEGMASLNPVQSKVYPVAFNTANNILLCAPTGAGKTNVAVLTILHVLSSVLQPDGSFNFDKFKVVYIAPMKALVAEVVASFQKRLDERFGTVTRELTGDVSLSKQQIEETQIIVTTPEKWDIITRRSGERLYTQLVRLLIIDEVHLLHDERGPVLESVIARSLRYSDGTQDLIRLVGLSATLPNYDDVATLLRVKRDAGLFFFNASYRPCPLAQTFIGVTIKKPLQRFQQMNEICYKKVLDAAGKHQVMIFVHSRKETAKTASYLKDTALEEGTLSRFVKPDSAARELLQESADSTKNPQLATLLPHGFGIHHAGMQRVDRTMVEDLFADGHIQVLVSTATLAWGVNLPAHTVIIKGTQVYNPVKSGWDELSPQDVMQMLGRAGRPQFDTFGEGIIITQHSELHYYLSLLNEQLPIESQFVRKLADSLNAEVVMGSVQNLREAANWLGYTYLNIRMLRKPAQYGVPLAEVDADPRLLTRRKDLCHSAALELDRNGLVRYDRKTGGFQSTDLGRIASHYYISHTTLRAFNEQLKPTMSEGELMRIFCLADEFQHTVVRDEEKLELMQLSQRVPVPIKDSVEEPAGKINILLQAYISGLKMDGLALMSDLVYISQSAGRLMRCLFEICLRRNWAGLAEKALLLCKAVNHRMWPSQTPLRQFKGRTKLTPPMLAQLEKKEIPWERYFDMSAAELGELIRAPKLGKVVQRLVSMVPRLNLETNMQPLTRGLLRMDLVITPDFKWDLDTHGYVEPFLVLVEDQDGDFILHKQFFYLKSINAMGSRIVEHNVTFTVPIYDPLPPQYFVRIISDRWLGSEICLPVLLQRNLLLPEKFHPPTELLDLQPLPVSVLRNPRFERLYTQFKHFNPIQTQVHSTLHQSSDSVLVCAPAGSGKTVCAEFALLKMVADHEALVKAAESDEKVSVPALRAVYVAPIAAIVKQTKVAWDKKFGPEGLGLRVVELTGELQIDVKLVKSSNIILCTAENWARVSSLWRKHAAVSDILLFIADEIHLLGSEHGPTLEVVLSRMRMLSKLLSKPIRMLGMGSSIASAKDIGDWLGAPAHAQFNFPPGVRPVPLEIHIQSMDIANFEARMQAMSRPTYSAIMHYAPHKPSIVFAPTRRHAKQAAAELMMHTATEGVARRFLRVKAEQLEPFLDKLSDSSLLPCVRAGFGVIHETMTEEDVETINLLFLQGAIQVLVATAGMCRSVASPASLVVVMGTQYYDSSGLGGEDYPITELLQMLGLASRPHVDDSGICVLMCHSVKKEYYKKFLFEPLPVESLLDTSLHDHLVNEVVTGMVTNKQEAVDWLTYTLFYRRLPHNPNYYGMMGRSHRHVRDHLSELVETVCQELHEHHTILVDESGFNLAPENLGVITAHYHMSYRTAALLDQNLGAKVKTRTLLAVLCSVPEFEALPMRPGEDGAVARVLKHAKYKVESLAAEPRTKANALLQAHMGRMPLRGDMQADQRQVVKDAVRLLHAAVDVVANKHQFNACLLAMELCQQLTQALFKQDSQLLQLPGFSRALAERCERAGADTVAALAEMDDAARRDLLAMAEEDYSRAVGFCLRHPNVELSFAVLGAEDISAAGDDAEEDPVFRVPEDTETVDVAVTLERVSEVGPVQAQFFPGVKQENWWLVVGDSGSDRVVSIKRLTFEKDCRRKLTLDGLVPGTNSFQLLLMCDSYLGCDDELPFQIVVGEGRAEPKTAPE